MKYKFHNPEGLYFVSFAVVYWIKIFKENLYVDIVINSLRFCQKNKGMEIVAWCIMPDHIHLIFRSTSKQQPGCLLGDFKRFTSVKIVNEIKKKKDSNERRKLLGIFNHAASNSNNVKHHQFWQHYNHPVELWSNGMIQQKINYIHKNPVVAGLVAKPEDYVYSSAKTYAGEIGLINDLSKLEFY